MAKQMSLQHGNHILVFDNFFNNPDVMQQLKSWGISAVGTVRKNRVGLPKKMAITLDRGSFDYRQSSTGLFYVKWMDTKAVHFLSNYHGYEWCTVDRTQKNGTKLAVSALSVVQDYNRNMGGVDKADMLRSLYELDRKSNKFWHRYVSLVFYIDNIYIVSFINCIYFISVFSLPCSKWP